MRNTLVHFLVQTITLATKLFRKKISQNSILSVGFCGVISAGLAIVTAFGLLMYAGVPFVDLVAASPFLAIGKCVIYLILFDIIIPCYAYVKLENIGKVPVHLSLHVSVHPRAFLHDSWMDFLHIRYAQVSWAAKACKIKFGAVPNLNNYVNFIINFECFFV